MTDTMREKFEAWHDSIFDVSASTATKNDYGYPDNAHVQMRWQAWQAAQADARALVGELVEAMQADKCDPDAISKAQAFMEGK